uniref:Uncharacterized protein n=1 Tax=Arsenophonus nasoniae TaxID=638 RepID=D2U3V8_9GAMM|nr:hypothetical protein ARN_33560 [Arsenophonus nasoniae]
MMQILTLPWPNCLVSLLISVLFFDKLFYLKGIIPYTLLAAALGYFIEYFSCIVVI